MDDIYSSDDSQKQEIQHTSDNESSGSEEKTYTSYPDFMYTYENETPPVSIRKRKNTNGEKFIIFLFVVTIIPCYFKYVN